MPHARAQTLFHPNLVRYRSNASITSFTTSRHRHATHARTNAHSYSHLCGVRVFVCLCVCVCVCACVSRPTAAGGAGNIRACARDEPGSPVGAKERASFFLIFFFFLEFFSAGILEHRTIPAALRAWCFDLLVRTSLNLSFSVCVCVCVSRILQKFTEMYQTNTNEYTRICAHNYYRQRTKLNTQMYILQLKFVFNEN
jgi:hypothetical protein